MTARAGSIHLIADARGDGTAALVQSMYAVVDFLPDHRHMVKADALAAVADFAHTVTIQAGELLALTDATITATVQTGSFYLLADLNPNRINVASIYAVCDAERPKFAHTGSLNAVVNTRSQTPAALVSELMAVASAGPMTLPPAVVSTVQAVVLLQIPIEIQAAALYAVAAIIHTPQMRAASLFAIVNAFAQHQARVYSTCAVVDAVLAGHEHEYRNNRMRHGKRSKLGAISPYNATAQ